MEFIFIPICEGKGIQFQNTNKRIKEEEEEQESWPLQYTPLQETRKRLMLTQQEVGQASFTSKPAKDILQDFS
jgi:hypothetical protein